MIVVQFLSESVEWHTVVTLPGWRQTVPCCGRPMESETPLSGSFCSTHNSK